MNESLRIAFNRLRLSGMAASPDARPREAAGHQLSHAGPLGLASRNELRVRGQRRIERRNEALAEHDKPAAFGNGKVAGRAPAGGRGPVEPCRVTGDGVAGRIDLPRQRRIESSRQGLHGRAPQTYTSGFDEARVASSNP